MAKKKVFVRFDYEREKSMKIIRGMLAVGLTPPALCRLLPALSV